MRGNRGKPVNTPLELTLTVSWITCTQTPDEARTAFGILGVAGARASRVGGLRVGGGGRVGGLGVHGEGAPSGPRRGNRGGGSWDGDHPGIGG